MFKINLGPVRIRAFRELAYCAPVFHPQSLGGSCPHAKMYSLKSTLQECRKTTLWILRLSGVGASPMWLHDKTRL